MRDPNRMLTDARHSFQLASQSDNVNDIARFAKNGRDFLHLAHSSAELTYPENLLHRAANSNRPQRSLRTYDGAAIRDEILSKDYCRRMEAAYAIKAKAATNLELKSEYEAAMQKYAERWRKIDAILLR